VDAAREYTDREIRRVARELAVEYGREGDLAASEVLEFLTSRTGDDGLVPESALQGREWARLRSEVARQMSDRNRSSAEAIDGRMETVRDLTADGADPSSKVPRPAIDRRRDLTWNERHVEAAARASVGKDPEVAAKGVRGLADMNRNAAVRRARTAINGAENAGRMDAMLAKGGSKRWVAVMDERTRASHASINGEVVPVAEPFSNGLMYPGDPSGPPEEVYNCRCTMEWIRGAGGAIDPVPTDEVTAERFVSALDAAKESCPVENAWRVDTSRSAEDFNRDRVTMYITENGSTFALKDDGDIISVCKNQITDRGTNARSLMAAAVEAGGTHLDSFDGNYGFYVRCGFEPVSRCRFSKEFAPEGWVDGRDAEEDIYFMRYVGVGNVKLDTLEKARGAIPYSDGYDEAEAVVKELIRK
jgi:SPP1 gp7 family putative phage head morphogenesis protein